MANLQKKQKLVAKQQELQQQMINPNQYTTYQQLNQTMLHEMASHQMDMLQHFQHQQAVAAAALQSKFNTL